MTIQEAAKTVIQEKYATFNGRAQQAEFWWYALFQFLLTLVCNIIDNVIFRGHAFLAAIVALALIVPSIAVTIRRLHDTDKSGWLLLLALIPLIGGIIVLVLCIPKGTAGPNAYGPDPLVADNVVII